MKKIITVILIAIAVLSVAYYAFSTAGSSREQVSKVDYKNIAYRINNETMLLKNGFAETDVAPGSASKITTRYFGNEYIADLDNDGREDVVFLLTQETGGSGVFYYVVGALNTAQGYVGTDGYLLGDRIAPQTIGMSSNSQHKNVIVVNYADRARDEAFTVLPSMGKSVYLKIDTANMMWGIVEPNFEGESR